MTASDDCTSCPAPFTSPANCLPDDGLFPASLISQAEIEALPEGHRVRPLRRTDQAGLLDVLRVLTKVGDIDDAAWAARYDWMARANGFCLDQDRCAAAVRARNMQARVESVRERAVANGEELKDEEVVDRAYKEEADGQVQRAVEEGTYFIVVIEDPDGRIVGTGSLIVERKFIRSLGKTGHIEDIAVAKDQQGKKFGLRLINILADLAQKVGCYKTLLDCEEAKEGFYQKCGYTRAGIFMTKRFD